MDKQLIISLHEADDREFTTSDLAVDQFSLLVLEDGLKGDAERLNRLNEFRPLIQRASHAVESLWLSNLVDSELSSYVAENLSFPALRNLILSPAKKKHDSEAVSSGIFQCLLAILLQLDSVILDSVSPTIICVSDFMCGLGPRLSHWLHLEFSVNSETVPEYQGTCASIAALIVRLEGLVRLRLNFQYAPFVSPVGDVYHEILRSVFGHSSLSSVRLNLPGRGRLTAVPSDITDSYMPTHRWKDWISQAAPMLGPTDRPPHCKIYLSLRGLDRANQALLQAATGIDFLLTTQVDEIAWFLESYPARLQDLVIRMSSMRASEKLLVPIGTLSRVSVFCFCPCDVRFKFSPDTDCLLERIELETEFFSAIAEEELRQAISTLRTPVHVVVNHEEWLPGQPSSRWWMVLWMRNHLRSTFPVDVNLIRYVEDYARVSSIVVTEVVEGELVMAFDDVWKFTPVQILRVDPDQKKCFVHYLGWQRKWDQWISWDTGRVGSLSVDDQLLVERERGLVGRLSSWRR